MQNLTFSESKLITINLTIYNPRDFKYRVRHPLVSTSWRLRECTDFDKWHLKSNLMTWCWNWYDFYVDSPLLSDVAMSWKIVNSAHLPRSWIFKDIAIMPFDKKLACLTNYQERRSFPWPLVLLQMANWKKSFRIGLYEPFYLRHGKIGSQLLETRGHGKLRLSW